MPVAAIRPESAQNDIMLREVHLKAQHALGTKLRNEGLGMWSIANALRIHADTLRQARQHAAEELAAKASVKMSFPLVLFIFPATFIVLAGPTVIGLMKSALFNE